MRSEIVQWVVHYAALLPVLAVAWAALRGRVPRGPVRLLAAAFALSWVADSVGAKLQAVGQPTLWVTFILAPVQYALILLAVRPASFRRTVWLFFGLVVLASWAGGDWSGIEIMVHVVCGAWVCLVIARQPDLEHVRTAVLVYCGLAIPWLLTMGFADPYGIVWPVAWYGYQTVRIAALAMLGYFVVSQPRMRLEVVAGGPSTDTAGGRAVARGTGHTGDRHRHRAGRESAARPA